MADLAPIALWPVGWPDRSRLYTYGLKIVRREDLSGAMLRLPLFAQPSPALPRPGTFSGADDAMTLWYGSRDWLFLTTGLSVAFETMGYDLGQGGWRGPVSDGLLILDIAGPFDALTARGCALDPVSFATGGCASTRFAGVRAVLVFLSSDRLRFIADVADEAYLHAWFERALGDLVG